MTTADLAELQAAAEDACTSLAAAVTAVSPETRVVRANLSLPAWMPVGISIVCQPADFDGRGEVVEILLAIHPPDARVPSERLECDITCTDGRLVAEAPRVELAGERGSPEYLQSALRAIQATTGFLRDQANAIVAELDRHRDHA
jgi:hypothetical protein